ncbi:hypothetical protein CHUAL_000996 [Chamberlinius hualienensis]
MEMDAQPKMILILSGKRKSGKDYIAELLSQRLGQENCIIIRLSGPLKYQYAKENNLNYEKLLDASEYKEQYREDMIAWGEAKRNAVPGYFCELAVKEAMTKSIWIVSDARRPSDIQYFKDRYTHRVKTIRVKATEEVRQKRGWYLTKGVDDVDSECALDNYINWDYEIFNNGNPEDLEFISIIEQSLKAQ